MFLLKIVSVYYLSEQQKSINKTLCIPRIPFGVKHATEFEDLLRLKQEMQLTLVLNETLLPIFPWKNARMKGSIRNPSFQEVCETPSCFCILFSNGLLWIAYRFLCMEHNWGLYNLKLLKLHNLHFPFTPLPTSSIQSHSVLTFRFSIMFSWQTMYISFFWNVFPSFCQLTNSKCDVLASLQSPLTLLCCAHFNERWSWSLLTVVSLQLSFSSLLP